MDETALHLVALANRFYGSAEAPTWPEWYKVFEALATRDIVKLEKILEEANVDTNVDF